MLSAFFKLLTLAALALMPFGMATASASPVHHQRAAAAGHCDEQGGQPAEEQDRLAGCTAGCSMFMADMAPACPPIAVKPPLAAGSPAVGWTSLPPKTATPPPKNA